MYAQVGCLRQLAPPPAPHLDNIGVREGGPLGQACHKCACLLLVGCLWKVEGCGVHSTCVCNTVYPTLSAYMFGFQLSATCRGIVLFKLILYPGKGVVFAG